MQIQGATVLVTGASGGLGRAVLEAFAESGAAQIYAAARTAEGCAALEDAFPGVTPLVCDVTRDSDVSRMAARCQDVTILVNNAGVNHLSPALTDDPGARLATDEVNVNYLGMLRVCRAMTPALVANHPSAIVNVLSVLSRVSHPLLATYSASKAAAGSLTQALRAQLAGQGVTVTAFMPGALDTAMSGSLELPKMAPAAAARELVATVAAGSRESYPDDVAAGIAAGLAVDHRAVERDLAALAYPSATAGVAPVD